MLLVHAVQPPKAGKAPGKVPAYNDNLVLRFNGVYTYTYETIEHFYSVGVEKTKDSNNVNSFLDVVS